MTFSPTPPTPQTAAVAPLGTLALLNTAPTPVTPAHPMRQAACRGTSLSIGTTWISFTTVISLNADVAAKLKAGSPRTVKGLVMFPMLCRHQVGLPVLQWRHIPQLARVVMTTWSPGLTLDTSSPTSSTIPAPSWPSTEGDGQGIVPLITLMSLWHTPAATIRTLTSAGPGARTSKSSVISAFPSANTIPLTAPHPS